MKRFVVIALLLSATQAVAQNNVPTAGYLVRLQWTTAYENVCALVSADGNYRLEETHQRSLYAGFLLGEPVTRLRAILDDPTLLQLVQHRIEAPVVQSVSFESFQVTVARPGGWQDLRFNAPESRKSAEQQVEALLDFLRDLRKAPKAKLAWSDANGCVPAAPKAAPSGASSEPARPTVSRSQALMWMRIGHTGEDRVRGRSFGIAERWCLLVDMDGRFRYEKSTQPYLEKVDGKAYQGALPPEKLQELRALLDSPSIKDLKPETWQAPTYKDSERTDVMIPREGGAQEIHTLVATGVSASGQQTFAGTLMGGRKESGGAYRNFAHGPLDQIKPLVKWFHAAEKSKMTQIKGAVLNECNAVEGRVE